MGVHREASLPASLPSRSPGPVTAHPASSMGRQVQSTKSSAGSIGFGTGKRLADHASDVPGPGGCKQLCFLLGLALRWSKHLGICMHAQRELSWNSSLAWKANRQ